MISNTITLRKFFLWKSQWFCDTHYYNLLFEDIKINNYLQSIFSFIKFPASNFIIKRFLYKLIIQSNIHMIFLFHRFFRCNKLLFFIKRHKKYLINHFVFKKSVYLFFKQISFFLYFYIYQKSIKWYRIKNMFFINVNKRHYRNLNYHIIKERDEKKALKNQKLFKSYNSNPVKKHNMSSNNQKQVMFNKNSNIRKSNDSNKPFYKQNKKYHTFLTKSLKKTNNLKSILPLKHQKTTNLNLKKHNAFFKFKKNKLFLKNRLKSKFFKIKKSFFYIKKNQKKQLFLKKKNNVFFKINIKKNKELFNTKNKLFLLNNSLFLKQMNNKIVVIPRIKRINLSFINKLSFLSFINTQLLSKFVKYKHNKKTFYKRKNFSKKSFLLNNITLFNKQYKTLKSNYLFYKNNLFSYLISNKMFFSNLSSSKYLKKRSSFFKSYIFPRLIKYKKHFIFKEDKNHFFIPSEYIFLEKAVIKKELIFKSIKYLKHYSEKGLLFKFKHCKLPFNLFLKSFYSYNFSILQNNRNEFKIVINKFINWIFVTAISNNNLNNRFKAVLIKKITDYVFKTINSDPFFNKLWYEKVMLFMNKIIFSYHNNNNLKEPKTPLHSFKQKLNLSNLFIGFFHNLSKKNLNKSENKYTTFKNKRHSYNNLLNSYIIKKNYNNILHIKWSFYLNKYSTLYYNKRFLNLFIQNNKKSYLNMKRIKTLFNNFLIVYKKQKLFKVIKKYFKNKKTNKKKYNVSSNSILLKKTHRLSFTFFKKSKDTIKSSQKHLLYIKTKTLCSLINIIILLKKTIFMKKKQLNLINKNIELTKRTKVIKINKYTFLEKAQHKRLFSTLISDKTVSQDVLNKKATIKENNVLNKLPNFKKQLLKKYTVLYKKPTIKKEVTSNKSRQSSFKKKNTFLKKIKKRKDLNVIFKNYFNYFFIFNKYNVSFYKIYILNINTFFYITNIIRIISFIKAYKCELSSVKLRYNVYKKFNKYIYFLIMYLLSFFKKDIISIFSELNKSNISLNKVLSFMFFKKKKKNLLSIFLSILALKNTLLLFNSYYTNFFYHSLIKKVNDISLIVHLKYKYILSYKNKKYHYVYILYKRLYVLLNTFIFIIFKNNYSSSLKNNFIAFLNNKKTHRVFLYSNINNKKEEINISFILKFLHVFYIFHKNNKYNYIINLLFFYLNKKTINKLNIIKKQAFGRINVFFILDNKKKNNNFSKYINSHSFLNSNVLFFSFINNKNIIDLSFLNFMYSYFFITNLIPNILPNTNYFNNYNKSFLIFNWFFKKQLFLFFKTILFFIKYFFYLNIRTLYSYLYLRGKKKNNKKSTLSVFKDNKNVCGFLLNTFTTIFNKLINNNIISYYISSSKKITSFYTYYVKKTYYVNYIEDLLLLSIVKNYSFYSYYFKYYIITFLYLFFFIEKTISKYSNNNCYLFITYSYNWKYTLNSAKMWCEYMVYYLKKKNTIRKLFFYIKKQQSIEKRTKTYFRLNGEAHSKYFLSFRFPLRGIRILYSGNYKKAKRKKKLHYYLWLSDADISGRMPLKKFKYYIDYYSSSVYLKRSSIGIKFWLLFCLF